MKLTFSDIISKKHLDPVDEKIHGLGVVSIYPLSASEAYSCVSGSEKLEGEQLEIYIAGWCCRMLKGGKATNNEIEKFRKNNTASTIKNIYLQGLSVNAVSDDSKEAIEKNSLTNQN